MIVNEMLFEVNEWGGYLVVMVLEEMEMIYFVFNCYL